MMLFSLFITTNCLGEFYFLLLISFYLCNIDLIYDGVDFVRPYMLLYYSIHAFLPLVANIEILSDR